MQVRPHSLSASVPEGRSEAYRTVRMNCNLVNCTGYIVEVNWTAMYQDAKCVGFLLGD